MSIYSPAASGHAYVGEANEHLSAQALARETELFRIAVRADSNLELDWLWLSMQLSDPTRRRYSLERALAINPESAIARYELEFLDATA